MRSPRTPTVAALALLVAACGGADEATHPPIASAAFDPTSTTELQGPGGAILEPFDVAGLPALSDAAVEITVLDVRPSHVNTVDGRMPVIDLAGGSDQLDRLSVLTDVEVRVEAVLAVRPGAAAEWVPGAVRTLTLHGGHVAAELQPDEAAALGILVDRNSPAPSFFDHPEPGGPVVTGHAFEEEGPPTEPGLLHMGIPTDETLTEGDRLLMFVRAATVPSFDGGELPVLAPTHPYGVFRLRDGAWVGDFAAAAGVDPVALAAELATG